MKVYYLEGNRKKFYATDLCLQEMAYPLSWNICSFTDDILASIDTHTHAQRKKKMWRGKV